MTQHNVYTPLTALKKAPFLKHDHTAGIFWKFISTTCFALISMMACWVQQRGMAISPTQVAFCQVFIPFCGVLLVSHRPDSLIKSLLTNSPLWALTRSFASSITFLSWFCALKFYPISFAISFRMLGPLATFFAATVFLREKTTITRFIGLCITLLATTLLIKQELWHVAPKDGTPFWQLILLPFLVIAGYTLTNIAGKQLLRRVKVFDALFSVLGLNAFFLGIVAYFMWTPLSKDLYMILLVMGALEWLGQWALAKALQLTALNILAPLSLWRFAISTGFGLLFLGEPLRPTFLVGITLMILATPLIIKKR